MELDFTKLTKEERNLVIDRLYEKFKDKNIEFKNFTKFVDLYRKERYKSGVIKILEGDEILKGRVYGVSKEVIEKNKKNTVIVKNDNSLLEKEDENYFEEDFEEDNSLGDNKTSMKESSLSDEDLERLRIARQNRLQLNKLREFSSDKESEEEVGPTIIFDDNIKEVDAGFTLRQINSQLPQENLLDRFNFGYVDLLDDDDGLKKDSLGERIK